MSVAGALGLGDHVLLRTPTVRSGAHAGFGDWPGRHSRLTPREAEVLAYIAGGHTNDEIAQALFLSINSVKTHIRSVYRKIGVERRTQAVSWALGNGFASEATRRPADPLRGTETASGSRG